MLVERYFDGEVVVKPDCAGIPRDGDLLEKLGEAVVVLFLEHFRMLAFEDDFISMNELVECSFTQLLWTIFFAGCHRVQQPFQ